MHVGPHPPRGPEFGVPGPCSESHGGCHLGLEGPWGLIPFHPQPRRYHHTLSLASWAPGGGWWTEDPSLLPQLWEASLSLSPPCEMELSVSSLPSAVVGCSKCCGGGHVHPLLGRHYVTPSLGLEVL